MTIDTCYESLIARLTKQGEIIQLSKELSAKKTNDERVLFIYNVLNRCDAFPKKCTVNKTTELSLHYRNLGNQCFQKQNNFHAWQYYNLSLMHAPLDTDGYSIAIANRSAVLFHLKKHKECLKDIELALSLNPPEKTKAKLLQRKSLCNITNKENQTCNLDMLTLGETDPVYKCASSKLKVLYDNEMGRHVVAKEDINVGEVLVQEEPYITLTVRTQYLFSCAYCFSRSANLIPCNKCCFALYCSEKCKDAAWYAYHLYECSIMATLVEQDFTKLELLALRVVIKARTDHKSWENLFKTIKDAEMHLNTDKQGLVKVEDKWVYNSKYYTAIHCLESNIDKRSISDIFQKGVTAAVFLKLLQDETSFMKGSTDQLKVLKCVAGLLLHHDMTTPTNMHSLTSAIANREGNYIDDMNIGSAPYAFLSLINHSCAPNVVRSSRLGTGQITLLALRPIKKGMQLFDNYGSHHALEDRMSRQSQLKFQYKFICQCEACINDWPIYFRLNTPRNIPKELIKQKNTMLDDTTIEALQKGDVEYAVELFKPLCELASELEPYAPCRELADCQESIKQCLAIFQGVTPYGFNDSVEWKADLKL